MISARFDALPLLVVDQGSAERDAKETHKNIKDASAEIKKTAENVREKINAAADQVLNGLTIYFSGMAILERTQTQLLPPLNRWLTKQSRQLVM